MKQKVLTNSALLILACYLFGYSQIPVIADYSYQLIKLGTALFILVFVPLQFFFRKSINFSGPRWKDPLLLQGVFFAYMSCINLLTKQDGYLLLNWAIYFASFTGLIYSIRKSKTVNIISPHIHALLIVVILYPTNILISRISSNNIASGFSEHYEDFHEINTELIEENKHHSNSNENIKEAKTIISFIDSLELEIVGMSENKSASESRSLLQNPDEFTFLTNRHAGTLIMIGTLESSNQKNFRKGNAYKLKSLLLSYLPKKIKDYPTELQEMPILIFGDAHKNDWEIANFQNQETSTTLLRLELIKMLVAKEWSNDIRENRSALYSSKKSIYDLIVQHSFMNFKKTFERGRNHAKSNSMHLSSMLSLIILMVIIIFHIPKFQISDGWKMKLVLFGIIIVFEFLLLLLDSYVSIFWQNPAVLLGLNVMLAIGLVTLDNHLRENFLTWYDKNREL